MAPNNLTPADLFWMTLLLTFSMSLMIGGFAILFYWLAERSHRFDVNVMANLNTLNEQLTTENKMLKTHLWSLQSRIVNVSPYNDVTVTKSEQEEERTSVGVVSDEEGLPSVSPNMGS